MIGSTISHFRITRRLGAGGMGVVYEAEDLNLGRKVALKFLPETLASQRESLERFQREARAASVLNHPHICTIYDLVEQGGRLFLVMELLEGQTLKDRLGSQPLASDRVVELGMQMTDALAMAHAKGIVHRDLKPANLFLTQRGDLKILDFGLAKLYSEPAADDSQMPTEKARSHLTQTGSTMGTVAYMSPEQARGEDLDSRSDLFSTGVVLYEMTTGRLPFDGATPAVVFSEILGKETVPPSHINPGVPVGLDSVIMRALEKDVSLRYQSAADLRADLGRIQRDSESKPIARTTSSDLGSSVVEKDRASSVRTLLPAILVGLVLILGVLVWWLFTERRDKETRVEPPPGEASIHIDDRPVGKTSIAVLPLQNLGADAATEYLRLAVPDEITNALARVPSLAVRPFASSVGLGQSDDDPVAAGRELGATNIVTGQYFSEGDRLQLTLEAINVEENRLVWRESISVPAEDLLTLRSRVSERVRQGLLPDLGVDEVVMTTGTQPRSNEAYTLYARSLSMASDGEENRGAIELLDHSLDLDPEFAPAWAEISQRYYYDAQYGSAGAEGFRLAEAAAREALRIDPTLVGPVLYLMQRQVDAGELGAAYEEVEELLERRPESVEALFLRAYIFRYAGQLKASLADCNSAWSLDPRNRGLRSCALAFAQAGDTARARDFVNLDSGSDWASEILGALYLREGDLQAARENMHGATRTSWGMDIIVDSCGKPSTEASVAARRAEQALLGMRDPEPSYWEAGVFAVCGHHDVALNLLERAVESGYCAFPALDLDPVWADLREEPLFQRLREKAIACHDRFVEFLQSQRG